MINFLLAIIGAFLSYLLRGFVIFKIWAWFIVSTFDTIAITIPQAIGLSLLVSFLTAQIRNADVEEHTFDAKYWGIYCTTQYIYPLVVLLTAWVVTLFL